MLRADQIGCCVVKANANADTIVTLLSLLLSLLVWLLLLAVSC